MTLLTLEGFDQWTTTGAEITSGPANPASGQVTGWISINSIAYSLPAGLLGGRAFGLNSTTQSLQYTDANPHVTIVQGARWQMGNAFSGVSQMIRYLDSAGAVQVGLSLTAAGKLEFYRGSTANILGTGNTTLSTSGFYYIEVKCTVNGSTGSFEVRLNGATEISGSNVNTQQTGNANIQGVIFGAITTLSGSAFTVDDFYLEDANFLYDPANNLRVETLRVVANGGTIQFTPLSSTNASQVQEQQSDNDSTYNIAAVPAVDIFTHGSLASSPKNIYGVKVMMDTRRDDVSNMTVRTKLVSGGNTFNGTTTPITTAYRYYQDLYINDPNTSAPWTPSGVNTSLIGYERVT